MTTEANGAPRLGAHVTGGGTTFRLWTTKAQGAQLVLYDEGGTERERRPLNAAGNGIFEGTFEDLGPGTLYKFALDGEPFPDPYARFMPLGVHGPSQVWRSTHEFRHQPPDLNTSDLVIYELHFGTFTPEGTYRAAAERLEHLRDTGVTCLEILPLAAFPGERGWGYDGTYLFAPYAGYGPPEDLQAFIDRAHELGLLVLLDAVYNHFGPDGNYLWAYSPQYFTDRHKTPWGDALDYTNPFMRRLVLDSADHWLRTFRFDGFRLDATHEIYDESPEHVLHELARHVHDLRGELGSRHFLFCEDDRNRPALVTEYGMDGMWADDFHHQVRVLLTGERDGYYANYQPRVQELARCIERGWLYEGQNTADGHARGETAEALRAPSFVYTIQNHDQIGNRALGDRLQETAGEDGFLAASALLLFLPMTPLLFQGQEWMASTPFQYFSDHHGELGEAVTKGRLSEFGHFEAFRDPQAHSTVPDPQQESTFLNSKLNWDELQGERHARALGLYRNLLRLRRTDPVLRHASRDDMRAGTSGDVLWVERWHGNERAVLLMNFSEVEMPLDAIEGVFLGALSPVIRTADGPDGALPGRSTMILKGARA